MCAREKVGQRVVWDQSDLAQRLGEALFSEWNTLAPSRGWGVVFPWEEARS